jgi:hypothetical protein
MKTFKSAEVQPLAFLALALIILQRSEGETISQRPLAFAVRTEGSA